MKYVRRIVYSLLLTAAVNALPLVWLLYTKWSVPGAGWLFLPLAAVFLWVNLRPIPKTGPTKRVQRLAEGCELLRLFCVTATATVLLQLLWLAGHLPRRRGGFEPGEHPGLRCAGVLCKTGGGFEAPGVLRYMVGGTHGDICRKWPIIT